MGKRFHNQLVAGFLLLPLIMAFTQQEQSTSKNKTNEYNTIGLGKLNNLDEEISLPFLFGKLSHKSERRLNAYWKAKTVFAKSATN